jgi:crotonobetainyl-CoA:carnitine CoA-transferase CaiB-like acyl-CoA transferase
MDRLGFDEARARDLNPNLIYAAVSAFGAEGPYARRAGVDVVFQGESGMISITGEPRDGPHKTATTIADYLAGTNLALAVTAALAGKPSGGCRIDISLRDGVMAVQSGWNALALAGGADPERTGTASPFISPNQVFVAADAPFTLAIVSDRHFELLADALERPDLAVDYPDNDARMERRHQLVRKLARIFKEQPADYWVDLLGQVGLPVGHVLTLSEALTDPQARHHEMLVEMEHPAAGLIRVTGSPLRLNGSPARTSSPPATLGQHTRAILAELGLDPATIDEMVEKGTAVVS